MYDVLAQGFAIFGVVSFVYLVLTHGVKGLVSSAETAYKAKIEPRLAKLEADIKSVYNYGDVIEHRLFRVENHPALSISPLSQEPSKATPEVAKPAA